MFYIESLIFLFQWNQKLQKKKENMIRNPADIKPGNARILIGILSRPSDKPGCAVLDSKNNHEAKGYSFKPFRA